MIKLTYEDYLLLPNDGKTHEIIAGRHYNHPAPRIKHQIISRNVERIFEPYIGEHNLGLWLNCPTDVVLGKHDIVQPDKVFVARERHSIITDRNIQGTPDFIVEITSPSDPDYDREIKMKLYAQYQVPYYLIVDAQIEVVELYHHMGEGYDLIGRYRKNNELQIPIFQNLKIKVADIFVDT